MCVAVGAGTVAGLTGAQAFGNQILSGVSASLGQLSILREIPHRFGIGIKQMSTGEAESVLGLLDGLDTVVREGEEGSEAQEPEFTYTPQDLSSRFQHLFDANDPANGGSLYLQAKIYEAYNILERS
ncbi:hypothetical protein KIPB_004321 [Kipferlia bialata]|uniref:Uncharacterized protein n=1 Tax=Kipferlia bialata TaxID=797122 RepID=A0A9K3GI34_9EUKA|nr:hypothetical protein KIPB_004321 [Kipferlia bialata]|eukprot:g4321.t1